MAIVLISQGAEARVYRGTFFGTAAVVKERFVKKYRHPTLDRKLSARRMTMEVRSMLRAAQAGAPTPALLFVDKMKQRIFMELIDGVSVKKYLVAQHCNWSAAYPAPLQRGRPQQQRRQVGAAYPAAAFACCRRIGGAIARLHDAGHVHGDLTTSNMMLRKQNLQSAAHGNNAALKCYDGMDATHDSTQDVGTRWSGGCRNDEVGGGDIVLIDFGLSFGNPSAEDKAVDLCVLERAFRSTHPLSEGLFTAVLETYCETSAKHREVLTRLRKVQMRGRKRLCFG